MLIIQWLREDYLRPLPERIEVNAPTETPTRAATRVTRGRHPSTYRLLRYRPINSRSISWNEGGSRVRRTVC